MCISLQHTYLLYKTPQQQKKKSSQKGKTILPYLGDLTLILSVLYRTNQMLILISSHNNTEISLTVRVNKFLL